MSDLGSTLGVVVFSASFSSVWADVAEELGVGLDRFEPDDDLPSGAVALILAAGGEEERALDVLPSWSARVRVPLLLVGARASHRFAIEALRRGAADYFALPDDLDLLRRTLAARVEAARGRASRDATPVTDPFRELLGTSPALQETIATASRVLAHGGVTLLIGGETGTGKELLARALHDGGPRAAEPFVAVNCAAIPEQLLESELFGHERGAFTDAHRTKPGLFEEADAGTLFLDEIGHLPLSLQGKLLRTLDDRKVRRVGGTQSREVNVRIIAATHVDLAAAVRERRFREDLFYRLNVVPLVLPPLRDRGDDVVLLAEAFASQLAARYGLPVPRITPGVRDVLKRHNWPGNVRELRHAVERALLLSAPGTLDPGTLAPPTGKPVARVRADGTIPFPATLTVIQHAAARAAVDRNGGNKSAAARQLGVSRARLQRLLDRTEGNDADDA
jgi:two-component system, NtrC family, response regulator HydG